MDWIIPFGLLVGSVGLQIILGVPVAIAFLVTNIVGMVLLAGGFFGVVQMVENATDLITTFTLSPVPIFILMGALFFHTGLARRVFDALDQLMGRIPGRLSFLSVGAGTVFAALTGSSLANTAMLGSLLIPDMERRKYKPHMALGPILAVGGLAVIIPPSALAVLLAGIGNLDVGRMLIGGIGPGLLIAALICIVIAFQLFIDPQAAPAYVKERASGRTMLRLILVDTLPIAFIIAAVIGLILLGIATPTEAAAFGVGSVMLVAALFRCLTIESLSKSLRETVLIGGMVFFIVMGSAVFSQLLAYSGASRGFLQWATSFDMPSWMLLVAMLVVLLILGTFMDQVSIMLITVPIFFPLAQTLGFDLVWFAVLVLVSVEIGLLTPPFGLLLFIMLGQAPAGVGYGDVVRYALPFIGVHLFAIVLMVLFPQIVLYLPSLI